MKKLMMRDSHSSIEEAEDFILCFFHLLNNSKHKELRKEEAASVITDYNNEQLVHCLVKKGRPCNSKVLSFQMTARKMADRERPDSV